jgi:hypothetical protein
MSATLRIRTKSVEVIDLAIAYSAEIARSYCAKNVLGKLINIQLSIAVNAACMPPKHNAIVSATRPHASRVGGAVHEH